MKFTFNWLLEHLDTDKTLEEITDKLSMIGLEVEDVTDKSKKLKDFIIAKVIEINLIKNFLRLFVSLILPATSGNVVYIFYVELMLALYLPVGSGDFEEQIN